MEALTTLLSLALLSTQAADAVPKSGSPASTPCRLLSLRNRNGSHRGRRKGAALG
jgi:hypothetical protein